MKYIVLSVTLLCSGASFSISIMDILNPEEDYRHVIKDIDFSEKSVTTEYLNKFLEISNFDGMRLQNVGFIDAGLYNVSSVGARFERVDFIDTLIVAASFDGAIFHGTSFAGAEFMNVTFQSANISLVNFKGARYFDSDLKKYFPVSLAWLQEQGAKWEEGREPLCGYLVVEDEDQGEPVVPGSKTARNSWKKITGTQTISFKDTIAKQNIVEQEICFDESIGNNEEQRVRELQHIADKEKLEQDQRWLLNEQAFEEQQRLEQLKQEELRMQARIAEESRKRNEPIQRQLIAEQGRPQRIALPPRPAGSNPNPPMASEQQVTWSQLASNRDGHFQQIKVRRTGIVFKYSTTMQNSLWFDDETAITIENQRKP